MAEDTSRQATYPVNAGAPGCAVMVMGGGGSTGFQSCTGTPTHTAVVWLRAQRDDRRAFLCAEHHGVIEGAEPMTAAHHVELNERRAYSKAVLARAARNRKGSP